MDNLPFELHSQILELACTDDGTTARSLSLVSRYVREAAQPFLYQSIAVSGLRSLNELADRLESLPSHKRRVRRLFLSDWTHKAAKQQLVSSTDADMDMYEVERTTIVRVLDLVVSTLESLSIIVSCPFNSTRLIGYLFSLNFPLLEDLSIHGFYPFSPSHSGMPNLRRLHLSGNRNPHGLFQTGGFDIWSPKLVHLRISGLVSAASFAEELASALARQPDAATTPLLPATLPASLKRITIGLVRRPDRLSDVSLQVTEAETETASYDSLRLEWARNFMAE
ncbi:hypothetical protein BC835DRAFT_1404540 [Cytidiella melzeri]|nr:hypothetical protein BC835DRAFT_1404540 [Cytidiella melzeri]